MDTYENIALAALNYYDLVQGTLRFLGHSGNVTFYLETPQQEKFLLRIHLDIAGDDIWQKPDIIKSELLWLEALHRDTNLTVQEPMQNKEGKWVTQIQTNDTPDVYYCSLLRWIDGSTSLEARSSQQAYQLGLLMAQLHQHSNQWKLPQNFVRPFYDENRLSAALSSLYPAVSQGLITAEHYQVLSLSTEQVQSMMKTLGQAHNVWGLIHADLHEGNYLFHNEQIRPIDFARCGFGYYLYDVAGSLEYLLPQVRPYFLEGYQTIHHLPENYIQIVEGFFIMAFIENFSFHVNNPKEHEWLSNSVPYVVQRHIHKYFQGESFLFNM
jgi:Ser/Thr protein kinase RdoA (MazF antagonist)